MHVVTKIRIRKLELTDVALIAGSLYERDKRFVRNWISALSLFLHDCQIALLECLLYLCVK